MSLEGCSNQNRTGPVGYRRQRRRDVALRLSKLKRCWTIHRRRGGGVASSSHASRLGAFNHHDRPEYDQSDTESHPEIHAFAQEDKSHNDAVGRRQGLDRGSTSSADCADGAIVKEATESKVNSSGAGQQRVVRQRQIGSVQNLSGKHGGHKKQGHANQHGDKGALRSGRLGDSAPDEHRLRAKGQS